MTNTNPRVQELNELALTRRSRFYYCRRDSRYHILRDNALYTLTSLSEAEKLLSSLPIPAAEDPPAVRPPRERGIEPDRFLRTVMSRVYSPR